MEVLATIDAGGHTIDFGVATTREEREAVLALLAEGKTNREIGDVLFLAEGTVRNIVSGILAKLGVGSRAEAAARYARRDPAGS